MITLRAVYYARRCDEKRSRIKRSKGLYPGLLLLGIHDHCTPGLAAEIAMASTALCSLEEARQMLATRGCVLNIKTIRTVVKRFAARARLAQSVDDQLGRDTRGTIEGRRVVVSTDGGRLRLRKKKRGPKTKKGHSRYKTDWREPKLLIIYVVNEEGRQDKTFCPYLDGTLDGPDAVFGLMAYYLERLGITKADRLLFVADGALWIWERVKPLLKTLGLEERQAVELIDYYHAIEHLTALAKLKPRWSTKDRERWVRKQRRCLRQHQTDAVIDAVKAASKGTKNTLLRREREYFLKGTGTV